MEPRASAGAPVTWRRQASEEEACVGGNHQRYEMIWRGGGGLSEGQDISQRGRYRFRR